MGEVYADQLLDPSFRFFSSILLHSRLLPVIAGRLVLNLHHVRDHVRPSLTLGRAMS